MGDRLDNQLEEDRCKMKMFLSTESIDQNGEKVDSCTISDSDGSVVFITEGDWIEIGKMKKWAMNMTEEVVAMDTLEEEDVD